MRFVDGQSDLHTRGAMPIAGRPRDPSSVSGAIVASRVTGVAPMGVFLEAGQSGFATTRPRHELRFKWRFPTGDAFGALGGEHPWSVESDVAYGPFAAHVFETPGTHVVVLQVTDGTQTAIETVEIEVLDPGLMFAGPQTIAISSNSFDGAPAGAMQVATLADARAFLASSGMRNARFLFARGQSHGIGGGAGTFSAGAFDNLQFGAFGSGADPVLTGGGLRTEGDVFAGAVAVAGLHLSGGYDAVTGAGAGAGTGLDLNDAATHCVTRCRIEGFDHGVRTGAGLSNVVLYDCTVSGWAQDGVVLEDGDAVALVGCSVRPGVGADAAHVAGGPGRIEGAAPGRAVLWQCDLHSLNTAPSWRWNADGAPDVAGLIGACRMEGGAPVLEVAPSNPGGTDRAGDLVVERCYLLGSERTGGDGAFKLTSGGTTLRNCVAVLPDVTPVSGVDARAFVTGAAPQTNAANDASPVRIYSNSFVDLRSTATLANAATAFAEVDAGDFAHWTDAEVVNQMPHAPYLQATITQHAPFSAEVAFTPRMATTPVASALAWRPLAKVDGTDAVSGGTVALDDFTGVLREPGSSELGAHEISTLLVLNDGGAGGMVVTGIQDGAAQLEVTLPSAYAGLYNLDVEAIRLGPVQLRAPEIGGDYSLGGTVTATPSVIAWDPQLGRPVQLFEWLRGSTPIEDALGTSYVVTQTDLDAGLYLREQVFNAGSVGLDETVTLIRPSFNEYGVHLPGNSFLSQWEVLAPTPVGKVLFFTSVIYHAVGANLFVADGLSVLFHPDRIEIWLKDSNGTQHIVNTPLTMAVGQRVNLLFSADFATGVVQASLQLDGGGWVTFVDTTLPFAGTGFDLSVAPARIFRWADFTNYRTALATPGTLPDVTSASVRGTFVAPGGTLQDPYLSQEAYGAALIDVYGDAATLQAGTHFGTTGALTPTRTFFDV